MEIQLVYVLMALISALGIILVVFVTLHIKNLKNINDLRLQIDALNKEKEALSQNKLQPVNNQAQMIIDAANKKAAEIINNVQGISSQEKVLLQNSFQQMMNDNLKDYKSEAGKFSQAYDSFIANVSKDVKARLDMGLQKIIADTQTEMKSTVNTVNSTLSNLYKGFDVEVAEYKKSILKQIDRLGVDVIKQVSLKVLGKTLNKKEQEDLVIKSLDEAKKLGFFE